MKEENFQISMTKDEMLKFYTNKMIEDGIRGTSDFNTWVYLKDYGDGIDLTKYRNEILQLLYKDERIADANINNEEFWVDMVFYTSYCPYYYDEIDIDKKEESKILSDFYYYCSSRVYQDGYITIRSLIDDFTKRVVPNEREERDTMGYVLKKNIVETGFIDKYIQSDNETFITLDNKKEFEALLEIRINELQKQYETEEQEEFE